jgi:hypothetical protein
MSIYKRLETASSECVLMPLISVFLLGANNPCHKTAVSPFWGVQRGVPLWNACLRVAASTKAGGFKGVSPL